MVDYRGVVSIVSIVLYSLAAALDSIPLRRTFISCVSPWVILLVFCTLRIIGDSMQLATETSKNADNSHLLTGAVICNAIGLGPLLLISTRLLTQLNSFIHVKSVPNQTHRALATFELCIVVSTILTIVGGVQSFKPSHIVAGRISATPALKAGICLYTATYVCILCSAIVVALRRNRVRGLETLSKNTFTLGAMGLLMTLVILGVRVLYSLLFTFDSDSAFSPFGGNETIQLCLQSLPEWLSTFLYLCIAFVMRKAAPPEHVKADVEESRTKKILRFVPFVHWFVR